MMKLKEINQGCVCVGFKGGVSANEGGLARTCGGGNL